MTLLSITTDPVIPKDFFTLKSMLTLTGATGVVVVICNGIQSAFNFSPKWLGLIVALVISITCVYFTQGAGSDYFVGVVNGFLIYATAAGTTNIIGGGANQATARGVAEGNNKRRFFTSWW